MTSVRPAGPTTTSRRRDHTLISPTTFGIPFGFAGLSSTWRILDAPWTGVVADALAVVSAVLALGFSVGWLAHLVRGQRSLRVDLADPVAGPFVPVVAITPMVLSTTLLGGSEAIGRPLVVCFAALTVAGGLAVVLSWVV